MKVHAVQLTAAVALSALLVAPVLATGTNPSAGKQSKSHDDHKIGICHATGSDKNPYVYIEVDKHAAEAHKNHQDGRDKIGVKDESQCTTGATTTSKPKSEGNDKDKTKGNQPKAETSPAPKQDKEDKDHKVGICHATGSAKNPYVYINVDKHAVEAHKNHQDGRDKIGVKDAKDCKGEVKNASTVTPGKGGGTTPTPAPTAEPKALPQTGAGIATLLLSLMGGLGAGVIRFRQLAS